MTPNKMTFNTTTVKVVEFLKHSADDESALQEHEREFIREHLNDLREVRAYGFFENEDASTLILIFNHDTLEDRIDALVKFIMKQANRGVKHKVGYFYNIDTMKCLRFYIPKTSGKRAFELNTLGKAFISNRFDAMDESVLWYESLGFSDSAFELFFEDGTTDAVIDEFAHIITTQLSKPEYIEIKEAL